MYQQLAWQITLVLLILITLVFGFVVIRSGKRVDFQTIQTKGYRIRKIWFYLLFICLFPTLIYTVMKHPYSIPVFQNGPTQVVKAVGYQFYWELSTNEVNANQPVEFDVTSGDVNHGFGIYDENMQLLAQTQSMPGYTNRLFYTFTKPGKYQILCLEYCSVGHHAMIATLTVNENGGTSNGQ